MRTELQGVRRLWDIDENIMAPGDLRFFESGRAHGIEKICLRQTTGDSAGPQVDIVQGLLRQGFG